MFEFFDRQSSGPTHKPSTVILGNSCDAVPTPDLPTVIPGWLVNDGGILFVTPESIPNFFVFVFLDSCLIRNNEGAGSETCRTATPTVSHHVIPGLFVKD